jgi:hypothetical protein
MALIEGDTGLTGNSATKAVAVNSSTGALKVELVAGSTGSSDTTEATQLLVKTGIGAVTEAVPATDTASSGLNGRLQRIAAHLTNVVSYTSRLLSSTGPKAAGSALATTAIQVGGTYNTALPTMTNTQEGGFQLDASGRLIVAGLVSTNADGTIAAGTAPAKAVISGGVYNTPRLTLTNGQAIANQVDVDGSQYTNICDWSVANTTLLGKVGIDQTTPGTTDSVSVKSGTVAVPASTTRPAEHATPYTAGDVLGVALDTTTSAITFAAIGPIGKVIRITGSRLEIDATAIPTGMTSFRLHLYNATPATVYYDNAVWDLPDNDRAKYLGYVDLGTPVDFGNTLYVQQTGLDYDFLMGATVNLFGYLVTNGGFTPTDSTVKKITLYAMAM